MRKFVIALQSTLDAYQVPVEKRKFLVTLALSKGIGYGLALPTSQVENANLYYANTHRAMVEKTLSEINELFVIDYESCSDLIFKIWRMRYRLVYDYAALDVLACLDHLLADNEREIPPVYREIAACAREQGGLDVNILVRSIGDILKEAACGGEAGGVANVAG